jgi:hypothetical protein
MSKFVGSFCNDEKITVWLCWAEKKSQEARDAEGNVMVNVVPIFGVLATTI